MVCFEDIAYKASYQVGKLPSQAEKESYQVGKLPGQAEKESYQVGKSPSQTEKDSDIVGRMEIKQIKMNKKKCCIIYLTI